MRKAALVPGLKNTQKLRVIINDVGIHTTVKDVFYGVFVKISQYNAVSNALNALGKMRTTAKKMSGPIPSGLAMDSFGHQVQIDLL